MFEKDHSTYKRKETTQITIIEQQFESAEKEEKAVYAFNMMPQIYQQQHDNEIKHYNVGGRNDVREMCSENRANDTITICKDMQSGAAAPFQDTHTQFENGRSSQLKEAHSALVKILESAPISNKSTKLNDSGAMPSMKLLMAKHAAKESSSTSNASTAIRLTDAIVGDVMVAVGTVDWQPLTRCTGIDLAADQKTSVALKIGQQPLLLQQQQQQQQASASLSNQWMCQRNVTDKQHHHYYHRKRNKHVIDTSICDMDKSSDEEIGYNSPSSGHSSANEAELICPWKKTRIAREWHQSQTTFADHPMPMDEQMCDARTTQQSLTLAASSAALTDAAAATATVDHMDAMHPVEAPSTVIIEQETTEQTTTANETASYQMRHRYNYAQQQTNKDVYYDSGDDVSDDNG